MKSRFWLIFFPIWTLVAFVLGWWLWQLRPEGATVVLGGIHKDVGAWGGLFHRSLYPIYPWVILAPFVFFVCSRFPLGVGPRLIVLPVFALTALVFVFLATSLVRQISRNMPSLFYVESPVATAMGRTEFAEDLVAMFKDGLADSKSPPTIRKLESGAFEISMEAINIKNVEVPVSIVTEFKIDLLKTSEVDKTVYSELVLSTRNEHSMTMASNAMGTATDAASEESRVERFLEPLWFAAGLQLGGFVLLASIGHAVVYFRQFREREQRSLRLSQELAEARLTSLKSQLQPHFLFNSLNGISSHIHDEPDLAVDMVGHLGDLLRHSLEHGKGDDLIPLCDEIAILDHYLELQLMRFGERLVISQDVNDEALEVVIPPFILQPIAENVIRHVVETNPGAIHLMIGGLVKDRRLNLWVKDNGAGPDELSSNPGTGSGLNNLRERLETYFSNDFRLDISAGEDGVGTIVMLDLPMVGDIA